jgi:hypothetical protein
MKNFIKLNYHLVFGGIYDFYRILKTMKMQEKKICKANYNQIFKVFDFINENGPEGLKKEDFNVSTEEFNNIKNMFL